MLSLQPLIAAVLVMAASALATGLVCDDGYAQEDGWCYKLMDIGLNFIDAEEMCKKERGNLASIHSQKESAFIASLGLIVMIGLQYNPETKKYSWTDGTPFDMANWEEGYPMNQDFFGNCALLQKSGKWINFECQWDAEYVCKKGAAPHECPVFPENEFFTTGEVVSPRYPGKYISGHTCSYVLLAKNGNSVTIEFDEMIMGFDDSIKIYRGLEPVKSNMIIELNYNLSQAPVAYTTQNLENQMLVVFKSESTVGGKWKFHFRTSPGCWLGYFNGGENGLNLCYNFSSRAYDFEWSKGICSPWRSNMLSIQNAFQNAFVAEQAKRMVGKKLWLGLINEGGAWRWANDSPVQYTNWKSGEPNLSNGKCACMVNGGKWETIDCDTGEAHPVCYVLSHDHY